MDKKDEIIHSLLLAGNQKWPIISPFHLLDQHAAMPASGFLRFLQLMSGRRFQDCTVDVGLRVSDAQRCHCFISSTFSLWISGIVNCQSWQHRHLILACMGRHCYTDTTNFHPPWAFQLLNSIRCRFRVSLCQYTVILHLYLPVLTDLPFFYFFFLNNNQGYFRNNWPFQHPHTSIFHNNYAK